MLGVAGEFRLLVRPKLLSARRRGVVGKGRWGRLAMVVGIGAAAWPFIYLTLTRLLRTLRGVEEVPDLRRVVPVSDADLHVVTPPREQIEVIAARAREDTSTVRVAGRQMTGQRFIWIVIDRSYPHVELDGLRHQDAAVREKVLAI